MEGHYNNHKSNNGISVINLLNYYLDVNVVVFNNNNYENNHDKERERRNLPNPYGVNYVIIYYHVN